jgi:hypothetical protein
MRDFRSRVGSEAWISAPSPGMLASALATPLHGCANWKSTSPVAEVQYADTGQTHPRGMLFFVQQGSFLYTLSKRIVLVPTFTVVRAEARLSLEDLHGGGST